MKGVRKGVKGYVAGEDGKAGMRGRLVSKQGQILANALLAEDIQPVVTKLAAET